MNQTFGNPAACDDLQPERGFDVCIPVRYEVVVEETAVSTGQRPPIVVGSPLRAALNNRCAIVGMLALIGPLGLPFLWFSQRFSRRGKVVISVVFLVLTVVLPLAFAYHCVETAVRPLLEAFRGVRH